MYPGESVVGRRYEWHRSAIISANHPFLKTAIPSSGLRLYQQTEGDYQLSREDTPCHVHLWRLPRAPPILRVDDPDLQSCSLYLPSHQVGSARQSRTSLSSLFWHLRISHLRKLDLDLLTDDYLERKDQV
jgi:hypothetical protein